MASPAPGPNDWGPRTFATIASGEHYRLSLDGLGITLDLDRLRRDRGELHGHLTARCTMAGAKTVIGDILLSSSLNVSSITARKRLAELLADRAVARDVDFVGLLEELAIRTETAERTGAPSVNLQDVELPVPDSEVLDIYGIKLSKNHPTMLHGMGDSLKSFIQTLLLGELELRGIRTLLVDWEMTAGDHKSRAHQLFGPKHPPIRYVKADRPLVMEADRLLTIVHDQKIEFVAFDSVGFGCDGPPESAEEALKFMRAVRRLGVGSLLIAHQTKGENGDKMPFGSVFWFNASRVIYSVKRADSVDSSTAAVALYPTKSNLFRRGGPIGLNFTFTGDSTDVRLAEVADMDSDLASRLTVPQRLRATLSRGPMTIAALAEELDIAENTLNVNIKRATDASGDRKPWLVKIPSAGGSYKVGILEKRA